MKSYSASSGDRGAEDRVRVLGLFLEKNTKYGVVRHPASTFEAGGEPVGLYCPPAMAVGERTPRTFNHTNLILT